MKRRTRSLIGTFVGLFVILVVGVEAQQRETAKPPASSSASAPTSQPVTVHLEGCVFPKRALTAKQPVTVAESSVEDFVLSETHVIALAPGTEVAEKSVFKLDQVDQPRLHELNGLRVGVTGRVEAGSDLRTLRVTSIRETVGSCPVVPTPQA